MTLTINGQTKNFDATEISVAEVMTACGFPQSGVAVAINNRVVRRAAWAETKIADGAVLTVIRAVCGG